MQMHPDFEKLLDRKLKENLQSSVQDEKWFPPKRIVADVISGLIVAALVTIAALIYSERGECNAASHQTNTAKVGVAAVEKKN
ncbi:hypothetical protein HGO38_06270 [Rhizobium sp. CG5]|uniref:hypothetical protein n=1 Tax=Rhizobium sp. CG5 TaxID=2726076 RepID=UPI0020339F22|nr:hypothetical protein [Rhizobium sp. CG5]MCM2473080.1 hypothetical protein [Rhizobium sp. CG5]